MDLTAECVPKIFIIIKQSIKDGSWLPPDICAPIAGVSATLCTAWVRHPVVQ
jgi:hypothetical protein